MAVPLVPGVHDEGFSGSESRRDVRVRINRMYL